MIIFGVGCFHFGVRPKMRTNFSAEDYATEIEHTLRKLTTVSQIDIDYSEISGHSLKQFTFDPNIIPDFGSGEAWFPHIDFLDISFEIYLPRRLQCELLETTDEMLATESERFSIQITNGYHAPVAYVVPLDATSARCQASDAVKLVRHYLHRELQILDTSLGFEYTGPSPFHADFFVNQNDTINPIDIQVTTTKQLGYDKIVFSYSPTRYADDEDAFRFIREHILSELSFYYTLIHTRNYSYHEWTDLASNIDTYIESEKAARISSKLQHLVKHGRLLGELVDAICIFRADQISRRHPLENDYRNLYATEGYLKEYIDNEYQNPPAFPVNEATEIVKFRENRHNMFWAAIAVLFSGILGGLFGSLATYAFTASPLTRHHTTDVHSTVSSEHEVLPEVSGASNANPQVGSGSDEN